MGGFATSTRAITDSEQIIDLAQKSVISLGSMDVLPPLGEHREPAVGTFTPHLACRKPAQSRRCSAVRRNQAMRATRAICRKQMRKDQPLGGSTH